MTTNPAHIRTRYIARLVGHTDPKLYVTDFSNRLNATTNPSLAKRFSTWDRAADWIIDNRFDCIIEPLDVDLRGKALALLADERDEGQEPRSRHALPGVWTKG